MKKLMTWLSARVKERSSKSAIAGLVVSVGVLSGLSQEQAGTVAEAMLGLVSFIVIATPDK